jgi:hypothetical protein
VFRVEVEVQVCLSLYADPATHGDAVGGGWALGVGVGWNRPLRERVISGCHSEPSDFLVCAYLMLLIAREACFEPSTRAV